MGHPNSIHPRSTCVNCVNHAFFYFADERNTETNLSSLASRHRSLCRRCYIRNSNGHDGYLIYRSRVLCVCARARFNRRLISIRKDVYKSDGFLMLLFPFMRIAHALISPQCECILDSRVGFALRMYFSTPSFLFHVSAFYGLFFYLSRRWSRIYIAFHLGHTVNLRYIALRLLIIINDVMCVCCV